MKQTILLSLVFSLFFNISMAQSPILQKVKIEYEKKVNTWATLPPQFADRMKATTPQYSTSIYTYETDGKKSIYKAVPADNSAVPGGRGGGFMRRFSAGSDNTTIYTDFGTGEQIALKDLFEKTYLLTDSLPHYNWKITNEFRTIAGFNCRRANAIIMDSVFVVAFYTDEILAPGGPESMWGLPGTILGLVINRVHTTWYATKVNVTDVNVKDIVPPDDKKAEKTNKKELLETLDKRFNQSNSGRGFGNTGDMMIWNLMI